MIPHFDVQMRYAVDSVVTDKYTHIHTQNNYHNPFGVCLTFQHMTYTYIHITPKLYLSVHLSVTGGQRKRFYPETQESVFLAIECKKLELAILFK